MNPVQKKTLISSIIFSVVCLVGIVLFIVGLTIKRPVITYVNINGEVIEEVSIAVGSTHINEVKPEHPQKNAEPGFVQVFIGWKIEGKEELYQTITAETDEDIVANAVYEKRYMNYHIRFRNNNGQYIDEANPLITTFRINSPAITLPTAEQMYKEHHTFAGWYANSLFTGEPLTEIKSGTTKDVNVYAKWDTISHKIEFVLDGGELTYQPAEYVEGVGLTLPIPTREGYTFLGWFIGETQIEKITNNHVGDIVVTAKWEVVPAE